VVDGPSRAVLSRRARNVGVLSVAVVVVFGSLLASAVFHSMLVTGQAHLDDVNTEIRVEREALQRDQLRLASIQSPERIAREAVRLGMVKAERQTWINPGSDEPAVTTGDEAGDGPVAPTDRTGGGDRSELAAATAGTPDDPKDATR
jgi:hypothetical protein